MAGYTQKLSWSQTVRKNQPKVEDRTWRRETAYCKCSLSNGNVSSYDSLEIFVHCAHEMGKIECTLNFEKDDWTPQKFGRLIAIVSQAACPNMDESIREFHQLIRNNGLWANWIDAVSDYPHFKDLLIDELAQVIENLSPKYLKDITIEHLLEIFKREGDQPVPGKKRKLKRQIQKWLEVQDASILNEHYEEINQLKWLVLQVVEDKDKETKEREHKRRINHSSNSNWRNVRTLSPSLSPSSSSSSGASTASGGSGYSSPGCRPATPVNWKYGQNSIAQDLYNDRTNDRNQAYGA